LWGGRSAQHFGWGTGHPQPDNCFNDAVQIASHFAVPKSQDGKTFVENYAIAYSVVQGIVRMATLFAIKLNRHF
jgi:hypothetical protein